MVKFKNGDRCEDCKQYSYTSNILGGVAVCIKHHKNLLVYWPNAACEDFEDSREIVQPTN